MELNLQRLSIELNSQNSTVKLRKADQLKDSLKIAVKMQGNLRLMFTNKSKKLAAILDKADKGEVVEDDIELLKANQQKLLDARPDMRQLHKEIENI